MIGSFKDKRARSLFDGQRVGSLMEIEEPARRKLEMLEAAETLNDLRILPGNRLEKLKGKRQGQHSIRINDRWRICFVWGEDNQAHDVEICDYHD